MDNFFINNWSLISTVLIPLIALLPSTIQIFLFLFNKRKNLNYKVATNSSLLSNAGLEIKRKMNLSIEGSLIENPYLLVITFENTTWKDITKQNIGQEISITLPSSTTIFSSETSFSRSNNYTVNSQINENTLKIDKFILNSSDAFSVKFIVNSPKEILVDDIKVDGYISGFRLKKVKIAEDEQNITDSFFSIGFLFSFLMFFLSFIFKNLFSENTFQWVTILSFLGILLFGTYLSTIAIRNLLNRKKQVK